jgi:uncharacterized protein YggT (Ycf19 family)
MRVVLSERAMSLPDGDFSENGNRFVSGMCKPMLSLFDTTVRQRLIPRPDDLKLPSVNMRCAGTKRVSFSEDDEADRHASFKMPLRIAIVIRTCLRILLTLIYIYSMVTRYPLQKHILNPYRCFQTFFRECKLEFFKSCIYSLPSVALLPSE